MTKRSIVAGDSTTAGHSSRPTEAAKAPSFPAANSNALARAGLCGAAFATTVLAKDTTSPESERVA
ncbi:MAG TPA: hypothetical protein VMU76_00810 [Acidimicrobiales bacterium]|nr:hypothetical protein [Acidimicrobiales bacterium]